jgi:hypothetical protein
LNAYWRPSRETEIKKVKIQKSTREVPKELCLKAQLNEMHHSKARIPTLFPDFFSSLPLNSCCSFPCPLFMSSQLNAKQFERERDRQRIRRKREDGRTQRTVLFTNISIKRALPKPTPLFPYPNAALKHFVATRYRKHGARVFITNLVVFSCHPVLGNVLKTLVVSTDSFSEFLRRAREHVSCPSAKLNTTNGNCTRHGDRAPRIYNHDSTCWSVGFPERTRGMRMISCR